MNQHNPKADGFLGRGPVFWFIMTFVSTAAIAGLALSEAIEHVPVILSLFAAPIFSLFGLGMALLNKNEAGSGDCVNKGLAQRRYIKRVALFTSLYLATFAALTFIDQLGEVPQIGRLIVAALPGFAVMGIFWAIGRLIVEETDEFMRMLTVRQTLVASALAMSAASVWGFLESADQVPHIDAYWYAVIWFGGLFVGALGNRIQYGTWGAA